MSTPVVDSKQNIDSKQSFWRKLKRTGPGLVIAATTIGPGSVTLTTLIGSKYAYSLFWVLVLAVIVRWVFQTMLYRTSIITEKPLMETIHDYNPWLALLTGIACLLTALSFEIGNATGTALGIQLFIPGLSIPVAIAIACVIAIILLWAKDIFSSLQRVMTGIVIVMLLCFLFSLFMAGGPSPVKLAAGLMPHFPDKGASSVALGLFSSSTVLTAVLFGTYLGRQKKWSEADIKSGAILADVGISVGAVFLISSMMMLTAAVVLNPKHVVVNSGIAMAKALVPVAGSFAQYVFGLGFFGAAISSLVVTSMIGPALFLGGLGKEPQLGSRSFRVAATIIIIFSGLVGITMGQSPVQLITLANIGSFISMPVIGAAAILAANSAKMKQYKNSLAMNIVSWILYLSFIGLAINSISQVF